MRMKSALALCIVGILLWTGCAAPVQQVVTQQPVVKETVQPKVTGTGTPTVEATDVPTAAATEAPTATATPTATPTETPTVAPTATPTPTPTETPTGSLQGLVIGIDPGHQGKGNNEQEPIGPGATETKKKVSYGTQGKWSRVPEYEVVLNVGLRLKELLESAGATVIMSRETNAVNISNAERAILMNEADCDLVLRIHCDGNDNTSLQGASMLVPVGDYTTAEVQAVSAAAGQVILDRFVAVTGAKSRGLRLRSDLSGFNWSTVPVCLIEMGYMSNKEEDLLLASEAYQEKCAEGLYEGILLYFN